MRKKILKSFILFGIYFLSFSLIGFDLWIKRYFGFITIQQLSSCLSAPLSGTPWNLINSCILYLLIIPIIGGGFMMSFPFFIKEIPNKIFGKKFLFFKKIKESSYSFYMIFLGILFLGVLSLYLFCKYNIFEYFNHRNYFTTFYEENYVFPQKTDIRSPKNKQNLILIYLESVEKDFSDPKKTGDNLIPHLMKLSEENLSFTTFKTGFSQYWTMGALIASMTGTPINYGSDFQLFKDQLGAFVSDFLPKTYSLGEILRDFGYHNFYVQGGSAVFSGTYSFLKKHGFEEVYAKREIFKKYPALKIPKNWWGYRDRDTLTVFKEKLKEFSQKTPFFGVLFTLDTHQGEYSDPQMEIKFKKRTQNVIYNSSTLIYDLVKWLKQQPFFKNTTVVILSDHARCGGDLETPFLKKTENSFNRLLYNVFINSQKKPPTVHRVFNHTDMFPTILESLGFTISGHRLGIGTSLFSDKKTFVEQHGSFLLWWILKQKNALYLKLWEQDEI